MALRLLQLEVSDAGKLMNGSEQEFNHELSQLFDTSPANAEQIWNEFFPRLIRLAKSRIGDLPKRVYDEEDVALSAMKSFFRANEEGRFERLSGKDELWRLLATITVRKVIGIKRKHFALKNGGGKVSGESAFLSPTDDSNHLGIAAFADDNLLPETVEEFMSTCEELLLKLPDETHRRTAMMRLEGYSNQEIAAELQCSVARTKQRFQRIREVWSEK